MKKLLLISLSISILVLSVIGISYAWFTYLETKSVASFTAGEIDLQLRMNQQIILNDFTLSELAFIDYDADLIHDELSTFDEMAATIRLDFVASEKSVLIKNRIQLIENIDRDSIIYLVIFEGVNLGLEADLTNQYHALFQSIISGHETKEAQLHAIKTYNLDVLSHIETIILSHGESLTLQLVFYGDYEALIEGESYLDYQFPFTFVVDTVNSKGDFNP